MKKSIAAVLLAACTAFAGVALPLQAQAQSDASVALSMMPHRLGAGRRLGRRRFGHSAVVATVPAALSVGGSTLTVVSVEASADGTVYVLERASDGARASIKVAGARPAACRTRWAPACWSR
jgi:hypothetical protein